MLKQPVPMWVISLWVWLLFCLIIGNTSARRMSHPCRRPCTANQAPMTCIYHFNIGEWMTMSRECRNCPKNRVDCFAQNCVAADGRQKYLSVANKQMPGPMIEVCKGDEIVVYATNNLPNETTVLHWHGIEQRGTPYMDGVAYITQCPIVPSETYVYKFKALIAETAFWHGHYMQHRSDGLFGGLIVREPTSPFKYDVDEHVIILNEWLHTSHQEVHNLDLQGLFKPAPYNILINGLGRFPANSTNSIVSVFYIEQGKTYRFRVIDAGSQLCSMALTIEAHDMTVISADGLDIVPVKTNAIRILAGERYDFLLTANKKPGNYWIQVKGVDGGTGCTTEQVFQMAILRYKGAPETDPPRKASYNMFKQNENEILNPFNGDIDKPLCVAHLNTLWPDDPSNTREPDYQFFLVYGGGVNNQKSNNIVNQGLREIEPNNNNTKTYWRFNYINFKEPAVPLLTQYNEVDQRLFCNEQTLNLQQCAEKFCNCLHILPVKLNSVVEVVLIDEGTYQVNHPIHLHGYWFRVVSMGSFGSQTASPQLFKKMDRAGKIKRKLKTAIYKDAVMVPYNGYTVIRFHADNPGTWLLHCHYESHANEGLNLVFKVGEAHQWPVAPPSIRRC